MPIAVLTFVCLCPPIAVAFTTGRNPAFSAHISALQQPSGTIVLFTSNGGHFEQSNVIDSINDGDASSPVSDSSVVIEEQIDQRDEGRGVVYPIYPSLKAFSNSTAGSTKVVVSTRRAAMNRLSAGILTAGIVGSGLTIYAGVKTTTKKTPTTEMVPVNITQVAAETNINITVVCDNMCVRVDSTTFQKKASLKLPGWVPSYLVPPPKVVRSYSNTELFVSAVVAGSAVEMGRTAVLYPLQTLKTRIQTAERRTSSRRLYLRRRVRILWLQVQRHWGEGNLYAGLLPSLLISVPAMGVYYGARDVTKRMLVGLLPSVPLVVTCALVADVVSLMLRTPADTLAVRLQAATATPSIPVEHHDGDDNDDDDLVMEQVANAIVDAQVNDRVGNWLWESLQRLPVIIVTDLPYLLIRIAVNSVLIPGPIDVGRYELVTLASACACAFLTTPFDVARTRILVDSSVDQPTPGLIQTFRSVINEGDGGVRNLYAGWLERTLYLGISSLWLPFALVFYIGIRDTILLEWFD